MSKQTIQEAVAACSRPLLTSRPPRMSYEEYRIKRTYQNAWIKQRLKGFICYVSSELVIKDMSNVRLFNHKTDDINKAAIRNNRQPFVGSTRFLNPI